ncbi:CNH domain-containing protein [Phycomyces blakesleeanus]|uniref:CNH domain-containing protein n=1 Tax=Phycomyces blakesleeanus TaxID=4837 RepID=A0ABR3BGF9_PHYBL
MFIEEKPQSTRSSTVETTQSLAISSRPESPVPMVMSIDESKNKLDSLNTGVSSDSLCIPLKTPLSPTPSEAVRDKYYQSHEYYAPGSPDTQSTASPRRLPSQEVLCDPMDEEESLPRPGGAITFAPLKPPPCQFSIQSSSDTNSIISLRTFNETDDTRSNSSMRTIDSFSLDKPKEEKQRTSGGSSPCDSDSGLKPDIIVEEEWREDGAGGDQPENRKSASPVIGNSSSLLSRLSKTTAPMRAKLSAISRSTNHLHLDRSHSTSLSIPLRRSAESVRDIAGLPLKSGNRAKGERSQSFSLDKSLLPDRFRQEEPPTINAALLSNVAQAFKEQIIFATRAKDSFTHENAFDGKEAVDKLCFLTKCTNRNLALDLGISLQKQGFFYGVNQEKTLSDSIDYQCQFKKHINLSPQTTDGVLCNLSEDLSKPSSESTPSNDDEIPTGVFATLGQCYSPRCTAKNQCYSPICSRLPGQSLSNAPLRVCQSSASQASPVDQRKERLWVVSVTKEIFDNTSTEDRKRQENIFELIYTENDFVDDLNYLQTYWITKILDIDYGTEESRKNLVNDLFSNIMEIYDINSKLAADLSKRQGESPVVNRIGDVMLKHVTNFEPFVKYGSQQMISKYKLETEKAISPIFSKFVEDTERLPESRKLELNGYLTKPTTRLGRYNLLLREILKHTPKDHPDQVDIPQAMTIIAGFLSKVNEEAGKKENEFNLEMLNEKFSLKYADDLQELELRSEERRMIMKGSLKRKGTGPESSDMQVYLLDNCLFITKQKYVQNIEQYKIYKKPIPLALLVIFLPDQAKKIPSILPYGRSSTGGSVTTNNIEVPAPTNNKSGYPIVFVHLGRQGFGQITLYANTLLARRQWVHKIEHQRLALTEKQKVFDIIPISERFFNSLNRVNCATTYGSSTLIGSDQGVYLKKEKKEDEPVRVLEMDKVSQIEILDGYNLVLVLADKILYTYSLDALLSHDTGVKRGRKISNHVSFFKFGEVIEVKEGKEDKEDKDTPEKNPGVPPVKKTLVCLVRYNAMTSTIRALEPHANPEPKKKMKPHLGIFLRGSTEGLKAYKDLYIPGEATSLQYFKNIICVGSAKGFQMVNIGSARVQSVLDPSDESHDFILQRESLRPISMFRHPDGTILLCYNEIAFYIDKKGRRVRSGWMINWEGAPTAFAFRFPYVIGFDPKFIEVRHMDTGKLVQVIPGTNIRCLNPDPIDIIHCVTEDRLLGCELVFELKFVGT